MRGLQAPTSMPAGRSQGSTLVFRSCIALLTLALCALLWLGGAEFRATRADNALRQLRVASLNVRYDPSPDQERLPITWGSERPWSERAPLLADQVLYERPGILGLQEVLDHQLRSLSSLLVGYDHVGVGRDDGKRAGEAVPVFWDKHMFQQVGDAEYFWLSETPEVPGSIGWNAGQTRMATLVRLRSRARPSHHRTHASSSDLVHVICTHFDDQAGAELARQKSAELILQRVQPLLKSGEMVLLLGDMNSERHQAGYQTLTGYRYETGSSTGPIVTFLDAHREVQLSNRRQHGGQATPLSAVYGSNGTFSGFGHPDKEVNTVIDFVLLGDNAAAQRWTVTQAALLPNLFGVNAVRLSDHRMVLAVLEK